MSISGSQHQNHSRGCLRCNTIISILIKEAVILFPSYCKCCDMILCWSIFVGRDWGEGILEAQRGRRRFRLTKNHTSYFVYLIFDGLVIALNLMSITWLFYLYICIDVCSKSCSVVYFLTHLQFINCYYIHYCHLCVKVTRIIGYKLICIKSQINIQLIRHLFWGFSWFKWALLQAFVEL